MKLTLEVVGERAVYQQYGQPKNESYVMADCAIDGSSTFVANTLRALADSLDPNGN